MLEIMLVGKFADTNEQLTIMRGRNGQSIRILTYVLYYAGLFLGLILGGFFSYITDFFFAILIFAFGLGFAGLGISRLLANRGDVVYIPPNFSYLQSTGFATAQPLRAPCEIILTREAAFSASLRKAQFFLNGFPVATLKNGEQAVFYSNVLENQLTCNLGFGSRPLQFFAAEGGRIEVFFKGTYFSENKTIVTQNPQFAAPAYPAAPGMAPAGYAAPPVQAPFNGAIPPQQ